MSRIDDLVRVDKLDLAEIQNELRRIFKYLKNDLTLEDNFSAIQIVVNDTTVAADTDFNVVHTLGRVPAFYLWNIQGKGFLYDGSGGRGVWTASLLQLRCSQANAALILWVL